MHFSLTQQTLGLEKQVGRLRQLQEQQGQARIIVTFHCFVFLFPGSILCSCAASFPKFLHQTDRVEMALQAMFCRRLQLTFNT